MKYLLLAAALIFCTAAHYATPLTFILDNSNPRNSSVGLKWQAHSPTAPINGEPWDGTYHTSGYWVKDGIGTDGKPYTIYSIHGLFRWKPWIPITGLYKIEAWWPTSLLHSTKSQYQVIDTKGITDVWVNQRERGAQWNELGTFSLVAGRSWPVYQMNASNDGFAIADALRYTLVQATPPTQEPLPDPPTYDELVAMVQKLERIVAALSDSQKEWLDKANKLQGEVERLTRMMNDARKLLTP